MCLQSRGWKHSRGNIFSQGRQQQQQQCSHTLRAHWRWVRLEQISVADLQGMWRSKWAERPLLCCRSRPSLSSYKGSLASRLQSWTEAKSFVLWFDLDSMILCGYLCLSASWICVYARRVGGSRGVNTKTFFDVAGTPACCLCWNQHDLFTNNSLISSNTCKCFILATNLTILLVRWDSSSQV